MSEIMHDMVCEMVTKTSKFMLIMSEKHVRMAKSIHILMMSHTNYPVIFLHAQVSPRDDGQRLTRRE